MKKTLFFFLISAVAFAGAVSCSKDDPEPNPEPEKGSSYVYILNEGKMGENSASLSRWNIDASAIENDWYSSVNSTPLGDVGNDIVVTDKYIIMAVNGSNIIEFCNHDGTSAGCIESVPGCRKLAVDPAGKYLYVTSWSDNGYVAKIDLGDFSVKATAPVGYEPEGIVYYDGNLYVANSGSNAWDGTHSYGQSISVVDADTMKETSRIDTGHYNLYGAFLQNSEHPEYILVNAAGDYKSNPASSFIFNCESGRVVAEYDFPVTYATQKGGCFYSLGSNYSYATGKFDYHTKKIDVSSVTPSVSDWTISGLTDMISPYGVYYAGNGELFVTDAGDYKSRGKLYRYDSDGTLLSTETVGICPGHFAEY